MNISLQYQELLNFVEKNISDLVPECEPKSLYEPFKYVMLGGGKRIRPIFNLLGCGIASNDHNEAIYSAVALEILHNFTLVHDDIMDNSNFRRNRPTVHKKWNYPIAILTGDVMIGYAYKLLNKYNNHRNFNQILTLFTNEVIEVCEGQILDMDFNSNKNVSFDDYINMIDKKTARLIETSLAIGGLIGNCNEIEYNSLKNIGKNVGLAFQIQDDILDMVADETKLGKKIGNDLLEGKKTILVIKAKETVNEKNDTEFIEYYFNNNGLKDNEIKIMDEIFKKYNIYDFAIDKMNQYFDIAEANYKYLQDNRYKELLIDIISELKNRKY